MDASSGNVTKSRRQLKNFLLQPLLQVKLGLYSILLAAAFSTVIYYILYMNLKDFGEIVLALTDTESEIRDLFLTYMQETQWWLLLAVFFFLMANVTISIVYTHKLVGPTIAFRNHVQRLIDGQFKSRVHLRQNDAFLELAATLNQLAEALEKGQGRLPPK